MDIFNRFPFSNAHELNLDWILRQLKNLLRRVKRLEESGGGGGTSDYDALDNKPQINGVILSGNKTAAQLNIAPPDPANELPLMDGIAGIGSSIRYARQDHRHPTDSTRASINDIITSYPKLQNLPQINGVVLSGNKTTADLHLENDNAFIAEYNITTSAEVENAYQAGKKPIIAIRRDTSGNVFIYNISQRQSEGSFRFGSLQNSADLQHIRASAVRLENDQWSGIARDLVSASDLNTAVYFDAQNQNDYAITSLVSTNSLNINTNTMNGFTTLTLSFKTAGTWTANAENIIANIPQYVVDVVGRTYVQTVCRIGTHIGSVIFDTYSNTKQIKVTPTSVPAANTWVTGALMTFPKT